MNWPTPTKVYDTYWRFAIERQAIFWRRMMGRPAPWTEDPIIASHRFTNCYRVADRVSQYLIRHVIYEGDQDFREVFFRTILFKLFNKIKTWELLCREFGGPPRLDTLMLDGPAPFEAILAKIRDGGGAIYSAAYMMPPAMEYPAETKAGTHLRLLLDMVATSAPERFFGAPTLKAAYETLRAYPGLGPFLAFQYTIDLNYSSHGPWDENAFVVAGPGAIDGIHKCFSDLGGHSEEDVIRMMTDWQERELLRFTDRQPWMVLEGPERKRGLHLIDIQNLFCEISKYARVAHPDIAGANGRTKIKQTYREDPAPLPQCFFPPKWGL